MDPVVLAYVYPVDPDESCVARYYSRVMEAYNEVRAPPRSSGIFSFLSP